MRRSEMSERQLKAREAFIAIFRNADWIRTDMDWFEDDLWAEHEANFETTHDGLLIIVAFHAEKQRIYITIENEEGEGLMLHTPESQAAGLTQFDVEQKSVHDIVGRFADNCSPLFYIDDDGVETEVVNPV